jgi:DNA-binding transcriptional LysR family regulator
VRLLERTPQGAVLTEAGTAFLPQAKALLQAARHAALTARAHAPAGKVSIGYVEDLVITPAVRELRRRHPHADISTHHLECHEERAFAEGLVDVLVVRDPRLPPAGDVRTTLLYEEPRVLVVPTGHPLAGRASVSVDDFAGEDFICPHGGARSVFPTGSYQPDDPGPISAGPIDESFEDRLELIAGGQVIAVLPAGDRRSSLRTDLVTVPVEGFPASKVVVVSRVGDANPLAADFVAAARAHLTGAAARNGMAPSPAGSRR